MSPVAAGSSWRWWPGSPPKSTGLTRPTMIRPHLNDQDIEPPISKTTRYKKVTKPLLERKRRARMNACYDELKDIMTGCLQTEGENVSKLEKADILELTVRHIQKLSQMSQSPRNPVEDITKFRQGYSSCANEAAQFLLSLPGVDVRVGQRLVSHLMGLPQPQPQQQPLHSLIQQRMLSNLFSATSSFPPLSHPVNESFPVAAPPSSYMFSIQSAPSQSIKTEAQVIPISPPLSSKQSDLLKPVPVKPSPLRLENTSPALKLDVWKPYSP